MQQTATVVLRGRIRKAIRPHMKDDKVRGGYGFIVANGEHYMVHERDLKPKSGLRTGNIVEFEVLNRPKGDRCGDARKAKVISCHE